MAQTSNTIKRELILKFPNATVAIYRFFKSVKMLCKSTEPTEHAVYSTFRLYLSWSMSRHTLCSLYLSMP